jgi:glutamate dehydrogenase
VFTVLSHLLNGSVRTNFYRSDRTRHYLSFKFDCSQIAEYGRRRPMYEIYVHHREVEGVHIRFGKVARGGLRWSDRDDYRTEILGLATTQQVKNVVIVPDGAKGGFYLKNPPRDPSVARTEADRLYKTFISGLLDVTDNTVDGTHVRPPGVYCHDPVDPYLVVAADKGTAHLSDTANSLSAKYGFWLGDAFASGGSNGYDHKVVGITARGGWVLVRRHFAEMGRDPYAQPFTCVGVGDLSGDVFGNGLIESDKSLLLAAFNHRHIFIDPTPDPATSFVERKRLFDAGRGGGWENYDTSLISEGGGIYDRTAKAVPLSAVAREMLGLTMDEPTPEEVIRAIMTMQVDLLWNGGIGTYVKASTETHQDANDRSNDRLRVDATDLRCRIIGEGGNLGLTQLARIEAARMGIRLNTDFIDNSGGVDLSDHEVNLKILLNPVVARGDMSPEERNELLKSLTTEVADLVLRNSDRHGRQLSRDQVRSQSDIYQFARTLTFIENSMSISRDLLTLPSDAELNARADRGEGLTRPELAVLSAWVKMYVRRELLRTKDVPLHGADRLLHDYFPARIRENFAAEIDQHMLKDEIAILEATNRVIADAGCAFFPTMIESTGRSVAEITQAYLLAQVVARADEARSTLEEFRTSTTLATLYRAWTMLDAGTRTLSEHWLSGDVEPPAAEDLDAMASAVDAVYELQGAEVGARNSDLLRQLAEDEIPEPVALRILKAAYIGTAVTVWSEARATGRSVEDMIVCTIAVGRASGLQRVLERINNTRATGRFEPVGNRILSRRFSALLRELVLATPIAVSGRSVDEVVPTLMRTAGKVAEVRQQVDALLDADSSVACLLVLEARVAAAIALDA